MENDVIVRSSDPCLVGYCVMSPNNLSQSQLKFSLRASENLGDKMSASVSMMGLKFLDL